MKDAIVRLTLDTRAIGDRLIDELPCASVADEAFEFHLVKRPR